MITISKCFKDYLKLPVSTAEVLRCLFFKKYFNKIINILPNLPVVQLPPLNPASHVHHPSVCRHLSILQ